MRRLVALLVVALPAASAAPKLKDRPEAEACFPTRVGTAWVLWEGRLTDVRVVTRVVDRDGGKLVSVGRVRGWRVVPVERLLVTDHGLYLVGTGTDDIDPPRCLFKPRSAVGDAWTAEVADGIATYKRGTKVDVIVPAGSYVGTPVTSITAYTKGKHAGERSDAATVWYSPGVGVVRIEEDGTSWVLKVFCPGR